MTKYLPGHVAVVLLFLLLCVVVVVGGVGVVLLLLLWQLASNSKHCKRWLCVSDPSAFVSSVQNTGIKDLCHHAQFCVMLNSEPRVSCFANWELHLQPLSPSLYFKRQGHLYSRLVSKSPFSVYLSLWSARLTGLPHDTQLRSGVCAMRFPLEICGIFIYWKTV